MSSWKEYKLEDVLDALIDYRGKTPTKTSSGIPLITAKIIKNGRLEKANEFIALEDYYKWMTRGFPKIGDILLTTEAPLGEVAQLENDKVALAQRVVTLRGKANLLNNDFLLYLLQSKYIQEQLEARSSGSTVKGIKQSELKKLVVKFPELEDQIVIANQLKSLDNKIQLNTQINQTLEQIAQAIFKSWFIDFDPVKAKAEAKAQGSTAEQANIVAMSVISGKSPDQLNAYKQTNPTDYQQLHQLAQAFPSEFEEIESVEVPKGWGIEKLDDLFYVGIGKTPPRKEPEWFTEDPQNIEWISIKDMGNQGTFITNSSEYLTEKAIEKFNIRLIPKNTTILSFKLTLGRVAITTKETTTNEAIAHFKLKKDTGLSSEFLYLYLKQFNFDSLGSSSSIATAINSKTIKNIPIIYPNRSVLDIFNERIRSLFKEMRNLTENSNELAKCRDLLLPKLLSGDI